MVKAFCFLLISFLLLPTSSSKRRKCCHLVSTTEACQDNCLELYRTKDPVYLEQLRDNLPVRCPPSDPRLESFWRCFKKSNESTWMGSDCCHEAIDSNCRSTCAKIGSMDGITKNCSVEMEKNLWACIYRQRMKNKCCRRHKEPSSGCLNRCESFFATHIRPTDREVRLIGEECSNKMASCIGSYKKKANSQQNDYCCSKASDDKCRRSCTQIYKSNSETGSIAHELTKACGPPIPHKPLWACIMSGSVDGDEQEEGGQEGWDGDGPEVDYAGGQASAFMVQYQCCAKAKSRDCRKECMQLYPAVNPDKDRLISFEKFCRNSADELEMRHCFAETDAPCRVGCENLEFCTNFNNRPTSLFRSCTKENDLKAKALYNNWSRRGGKIEMSWFGYDVDMLPVASCQPHMWKALACTIHIQPCSSYTGELTICKSDCLHMMHSCMDGRSESNAMVNVEKLCEKLTRGSDESKCISLSTYTKAAESSKPKRASPSSPSHPSSSHLLSSMTASERAYSRPCDAQDACAPGEVCLVERDACHHERRDHCLTYACVPGCTLSGGSEVTVPHGQLISMPIMTSLSSATSHHHRCFVSAVCDAGQRSRDSIVRLLDDDGGAASTAAECDRARSHVTRKSCRLPDGGSADDFERFTWGCNTCVCIDGRPVCTKIKCPRDKNKEYLLPLQEAARKDGCICEAPPCGNCIQPTYCAKDTCKHNERCVSTPRVCLTSLDQSCPQYECVPRHNKCRKLLDNAIVQMEGNFFENPYHRYRKYQDILSSSLFFSSLQVAKSNQKVCDATGHTHDDICSLVDQSRRVHFAYRGNCKAECSSGSTAAPVCGFDGVTYESRCVATSSGILVQHRGACTREGSCANVTCAEVSGADCDVITPPGACCPICAGMFRVIFDRDLMRSFDAWKGPVTVNDVVMELGRFVDIYECRLYGYLTEEDDLAMLVVPQTPTNLLTRACSSEAERIASLVNKRHPRLISRLVLSPLLASHLVTTPPTASGASSRPQSPLGVALLLLLIGHALLLLT